LNEKGGEMDIFFEYWKKGWKVWLMMICINFSYLLLFIPIAFIIIFLRASKGLYYFIAATLGLIFAPAITYYIFKLFYGEQ
jgi:hypothetical protein